METVLLVDDDKAIRQMLRAILEIHDFVIIEAANGKRLLEIVACHSVDLILLDVHLPDGNGLDFLSGIRAHTDVPVIVVSGDSGKESTLRGFDVGADDCVSKPFDPDILIAKVKANLRRYKGDEISGNNGHHVEDAEIFKFGRWVFDRKRFQIFDEHDKSGSLTVREFQLLGVLISHGGCPVKREDLCESIREDNYVPTPRAIDVKVARIRKKIGDDANNPRIIRTIRGVGYMFAQDEAA